jgi:hypothetical protein
VPGAIAIVAVLLVFPILVCLSGAVGAAVIGHFLWKDGEERNEGSELVDLNT